MRNKEEKDQEEKYKENMTNFKGTYLSDLRICLKFRMGGALPQGSFHSKNGQFPSSHY